MMSEEELARAGYEAFRQAMMLRSPDKLDTWEELSAHEQAEFIGFCALIRAVIQAAGEPAAS